MFFSDGSNRLENKTNYTLTVCCHAQCIILQSMSDILYSIASFYIWHCDAMSMEMTTYRLSRSKCTSSQCSNWGKKKTSDQQNQDLTAKIDTTWKKF